MFSYRHGFHAGNHADILKHITVMLIAQYLVQKEKPLFYMDTHAGAGLYKLDSDWAMQTGEAVEGIRRLLAYSEVATPENIPGELLPYITLCRNMISTGSLYPGSPEIVRSCLRPTDSLILSELHPTEIDYLKSYAAADKRIHVYYRDGFDLLKSMLPPRSTLPNRGFVLVDPGYEDVAEYARTATAVVAAAGTWKSGTFAVWYPLLERRCQDIAFLKGTLLETGAETMCAEFCVRSPGGIAEDGHIKNLYGSGMIVIRPTWQLAEQLRNALEWVGTALSSGAAEPAKYLVTMQ